MTRLLTTVSCEGVKSNLRRFHATEEGELRRSSILLQCRIEDHAHIVQTGNEAAAVGFAGRCIPVLEADNIRAALTQSGSLSSTLCPIRTGNEPVLPITVVTH